MQKTNQYLTIGMFGALLVSIDIKFINYSEQFSNKMDQINVEFK